MCGIAGLLDPRVRGSDGQPAELAPMLAALGHRGPDDEGARSFDGLAIGMRRLSILDPTPAGHQPMASPDGTCWLVHNGEIYDFQELARELEGHGCRFTTATDTEVILAAYQVWGTRCVERFNGIWAFALWDAERRTLFLSRDRFGVKPLFVAERDGRLAFASEIKSLLALPWVSREPDASTVRDFVLDGLVDHTDRTFLASIRQLPAAHNLVVTPDGRRREERYWGPPALSDDARTGRDAGDARRVDEIRALLIDAVALQLRSDVTVGSCLSGGVDSSTIVTVAAGLRDGRLGVASDHRRDRERQPDLAFFAEFHDEGIDERRHVDAVIAATGLRLRTTTPTSAEFRASVEAIVRAQDEPFLSTSIVAQYHVMRLAHEAGVKVLLDGQGADETFAGYPHYPPMALAGGLRRRDRRSLRAAMRLAGSNPKLLPHVAAQLVLDGRPVPRRLRRDRTPRSWLGPAVLAAEPHAVVFDDLPGTPLARALWRQISTDHLPALLRYEDRNSMAFSIEARVPFLDHRLVEAALILPDRLKAAGSERKIALRRAVAGIVPQQILDRRDKVAFQTPERDWILGAGDWGSGTLAVEAGFVAPAAIRQALEALAAGRVSSRVVWRLLCLELWLRSLDADRTAPAA